MHDLAVYLVDEVPLSQLFDHVLADLGPLVRDQVVEVELPLVEPKLLMQVIKQHSPQGDRFTFIKIIFQIMQSKGNC